MPCSGSGITAWFSAGLAPLPQIKGVPQARMDRLLVTLISNDVAKIDKVWPGCLVCGRCLCRSPEVGAAPKLAARGHARSRHPARISPLRYKRPEQGNRTGPESVGRLYIRGTTVVSASEPLKQQGFVSRQADIGDALIKHDICWAYQRGRGRHVPVDDQAAADAERHQLADRLGIWRFTSVSSGTSRL